MYLRQVDPDTEEAVRLTLQGSELPGQVWELEWGGHGFASGFAYQSE